MKSIKIFFISLSFISMLSANNLNLNKEERNFIDINIVKVAMIPNLYPFNMIEHKKLNEISYDILQLISKKSSLLFNYETNNWFSNINLSLDNKTNKIPLMILSYNDLDKYFLNKNENENIFYKDIISDINTLETIEYYTLNKNLTNLTFDDIDLLISPLLNLQANIIKNNYSNKNILKNLKLDKLHKEDIQFGINKKNTILYSIIEKSFNSITNEEWNELTNKWSKTNSKLLSNDKKIILEKEESNYLSNISELKICSQNNIAPIEFWENGKIKGLSVDVLKHINKELKLKLKYIKVDSLKKALDYIKNYKCDLILTRENDFKSSKIIKNTNSIFNFDLAIITKKDIPVVENLHSILNNTIAVKKDSVFSQRIKQIYPNIPIIEAADEHSIFNMITNNKAYFTLSPQIIASYYLSKYAINDLYISRYTNIPYLVNMAVNKDNKALLSILNKHLNNIETKQKDEILKRWTTKPIEEAFDYSFIWKLFIFILFLGLILIYRQRILNKYNTKLKIKVKEEIRKNELKTKQLIQQSKLAQMGELINMIAHQWRQPLTSISATTNNLLLKHYMNKSMTKDEQISELLLIIDYSQYMSKTINDFQNLYQKDKIKETSTLEKIVNRSLSIITPSFKDIEIKKNFKAHKEIETYPSELNQVILNILKNSEDALKRNNIKKPKIIISTSKTNKHLYLDIEDNALGIKEENIKKIFEPYFSTKQSKEGSGLGLYMSKTIVENNCGGKLSVKNIKNGVVFRICFDLI